MIGRVGDDDGWFAILRSALDRTPKSMSTATFVTTTPATPNGVALIAVDADGDNAIVVSPGANGRVEPGDVEAAATALEGAASPFSNSRSRSTPSPSPLASREGASF